MSSPRRSFFGSMKDKLRSRSPSPNPSSKNPFSPSTQDQLSSSTNLFPPASPSRENPAMGNTRAAELPADAPPPSYEASTNPTITVSGAGRPASIAPSFRSARDNPAISSPEDPYAFLGSFDTKVLIDDSGSMAGASWREVKLAIRSIAPICTSHDQDGIDVYFLNTINAQNSYDGGFTGIKHADDVERLFNRVRPSGGTPTGTRLNQILKPYLREYERQVQRTGNPESCGVKPVNMIVITDGVPTDDPESVIISLARKLDAIDAPPHQLGIQFFQVGKERGAAEALRELDDSLGAQANVRDIVDTVSWDKRQNGAKELSGDAILKTVLGAVVKRLDRRRVSLETPNLSVP